MGTYVKRKKLGGGKKAEPKQVAPTEAAASPAGPVRASRFAGLEDLIPALVAEEGAPVAVQDDGEQSSGLRGVVQGLPRSLLQTIGAGGDSKEQRKLPVTTLGEGVHLARSGTGFLIILDREQARQDRLTPYQSAWSPSAVYIRQKDGRPFPDEDAAKRALQTILG